MDYSPYNEVLEIVKNRQLHNAVHDSESSTAPIVKLLPEYKDVKHLEERWRSQGLLGFDKIFSEPLGFYLIKEFLIEDYSVDKAHFISDVKVYQRIEDDRLRKNIGKMMYKRYCWFEPENDPESENPEAKSNHLMADKPRVRRSCLERHSVLEGMNRQGYKKSQFIQDLCRTDSNASSFLRKSSNGLSSLETEPQFLQMNSNCIGVHGRILRQVEMYVSDNKWPKDLFDELKFQVRVDLRLDVFPRFLKSKQYMLYIKFKTLENEPPSVKDFKFLRCLGRGAFGFVNAAVKKDSGIAYAMKIIPKSQLTSIRSVLSNMSERNCLAKMDSRFVVCLKYALMDHKRLFYVLDLCSGGDMKFHMTNLGKFPAHKVKFYAAEILLGLEHVHNANIIYRDMKLENILLELSGHAKISDLGLGVILDESHDGKIKGYAGTPGYTAPEVVRHERYGKEVDLFSFGVLLYRMISAKKPWALPNKVKKNQIAAVDSAVVNMNPEFGEDFDEHTTDFLKGLLEKDPKKRLGYHSIEDVKNHPYFEGIHFGLLEGGFIDPPFSPGSQTTNVETLRHISRLNGSRTDGQRKINQEYEDLLADFPFYSSKTWQREIVKMLKSSTEDDMQNIYAGRISEERIPTTLEMCCTIQ